MLGRWGDDLFALKLPYKNEPLETPPPIPSSDCRENCDLTIIPLPNFTPEDRCKICNISLVDIPVEKDHIVPYRYDTTHYENTENKLQWLCARCNRWKNTRIQGQRLDGKIFCVKHCLRSLNSEFSQDVFDRLITSNQQYPSFRSEWCYLPNKKFKELVENTDACYFASVDISLQYTPACYTATHRFSQFSKLDFVEDLHVGDKHVPGAYLVTKFDGGYDLTWEGPRYYSECWVYEHPFYDTIK